MPFLLGFGAHVALLAPFALTTGFTGLANHVLHATGGRIVLSSPIAAALVLIVTPFLTSALCAAWITAIRKHCETILHWTLLGAVAFSAVAGVVLLVLYASFAGLGFLCTAVLSYWYYTWVKSRIPFAAASVSVASSALDESQHLVLFSLAVSAIQIVWASYWAMGTSGFITWLTSNQVDGGDSPQAQSTPTPTMFGVDWTASTGSTDFTPIANGLYFYSALLLLWGCQIIRNVIGCTVSGVVGDWWFSGQARTAPSAHRAVTTSAGSLCFAALVVSSVEVRGHAIRLCVCGFFPVL